MRWETERRPELIRWPALRDGEAAKFIAAYDFIESEVDLDGPVDLGQIALANLPVFRPDHSRLGSWYEALSRRPSMTATPLKGETHD